LQFTDRMKLFSKRILWTSVFVLLGIFFKTLPAFAQEDPRWLCSQAFISQNGMDACNWGRWALHGVTSTISLRNGNSTTVTIPNSNPGILALYGSALDCDPSGRSAGFACPVNISGNWAPGYRGMLVSSPANSFTSGFPIQITAQNVTQGPVRFAVMGLDHRFSPGPCVPYFTVTGGCPVSRQVLGVQILSVEVSAAHSSSSCTYAYSAWGACQSNGRQTRTVTSSNPPGCMGTPVLSQSCTPQPQQCSPFLTLNPASVNFGAVPRNNALGSQGLTLRNTTSSNIALSKAVTGQEFSSSWNVTGTASNARNVTLAPGYNNPAIVLTFDPTERSPANSTGQLTLQAVSSSPQCLPQTYTVNLAGSVALPQLAVSTGTLSSDPRSLNFGNVYPGHDTQEATLNMMNVGTAPLRLFPPQINNPMGIFSIANTVPATIPAGGSTSLRVRARFFGSAGIGRKSAALQINSDGGAATISLNAILGTTLVIKKTGGNRSISRIQMTVHDIPRSDPVTYSLITEHPRASATVNLAIEGDASFYIYKGEVRYSRDGGKQVTHTYVRSATMMINSESGDNLEIICRAERPGNYHGTLVITSRDANNSPLRIPMGCRLTPDTPQLVINNDSAAITRISHSRFGKIFDDEPSWMYHQNFGIAFPHERKRMVFPIRNNGLYGTPLQVQINQTFVSEDLDGFFTSYRGGPYPPGNIFSAQFEDGTSSAIIAPGQTRNLIVNFAAQNLDTYFWTLHLETDDDYYHNGINIPFVGNVVRPSSMGNPVGIMIKVIDFDYSSGGSDASWLLNKNSRTSYEAQLMKRSFSDPYTPVFVIDFKHWEEMDLQLRKSIREEDTIGAVLMSMHGGPRVIYSGDFTPLDLTNSNAVRAVFGYLINHFAESARMIFISCNILNPASWSSFQETSEAFANSFNLNTGILFANRTEGNGTPEADAYLQDYPTSWSASSPPSPTQIDPARTPNSGYVLFRNNGVTTQYIRGNFFNALLGNFSGH